MVTSKDAERQVRVYIKVSRATTVVSESIEYELTGASPMTTSADTRRDSAGDEAQGNDRRRSDAGVTRHLGDGVPRDTGPRDNV